MLTTARATLGRILAEPTPGDLWELQKDLLAIGGEPAEKARRAALAFHACLRNLASKTASRSASRLGAALGTAAVSSVGLQEVFTRQDDSLRHLVSSGVAALLEVGAAVKSNEAWEGEVGLMYDDMAGDLYGELWEISGAARPEMSTAERRAMIDQLVDPILDPKTKDDIKTALLIRLFQAVLAARAVPVLGAQPARRGR
jgi:hypothetical protein